MPWNQNIPQAGDLLSTSQPQILANFQALNTILAPAAAAGPTINMAHVAAPSPAVVPANTWQMYTTTVGAAEHLHLKSPAGDVIPMTQAFKGRNGWCYLPNGLKMAWFYHAASGLNNTVQYTYTAEIVGPPAFPGFANVANNPYSVQATMNGPGAGGAVFAYPCAYTHLTIDIRWGIGAQGIFVLAIGE